MGAMGPHSGGHVISYALWFKTTGAHLQKMILISYVGYWPKSTYFNVILSEDGKLQLIYSAAQKLIVEDDSNLKNGEWHHVAITMPHKDCLISEFQVFVDSEPRTITIVGNDTNVSFPNG